MDLGVSATHWSGESTQAQAVTTLILVVVRSTCSRGSPCRLYEALPPAPEEPGDPQNAIRFHPREHVDLNLTFDSDNSADLGFPRDGPRDTPHRAVRSAIDASLRTTMTLMLRAIDGVEAATIAVMSSSRTYITDTNGLEDTHDPR